MIIHWEVIFSGPWAMFIEWKRNQIVHTKPANKKSNTYISGPWSIVISQRQAEFNQESPAAREKKMAC